MKKIILVIGLVVVLTACGNKDEKETIIVEEKLQNMSSSDNLDIESNNIIEEQKDIENNEEPIIENIEEAQDVLEPEQENDINKVESVENLNENQVIYEDGVQVGKKAIDFEVELLSGEKVKLSDYLGKPVFLNFWATWCGPCIGEMPYIEKIKNTYGDKLVVLAINGGELKTDVQAFVERMNYTFDVGIDEKNEALTIYDSMYIPLSIFIDKNGVIQERQVGALSESKMNEIIKSLLAE